MINLTSLATRPIQEGIFCSSSKNVFLQNYDLLTGLSSRPFHQARDDLFIINDDPVSKKYYSCGTTDGIAQKKNVFTTAYYSFSQGFKAVILTYPKLAILAVVVN